MSNRATKRLERRSEREAKAPGNAPRPRRQRPTKTKVRRGGPGFNWWPVLGVVAAAVIVGIIVYAYFQSTAGSSGNPNWLKAELDASTKLPGQYVRPVPGPDGKFGTNDDREHFGNGVVVPICTADQLAQDAAVTDVYGDRTAEAATAEAPYGCYNSNPPTSGPHNASPMPFKVLDNPAPKENMIHNMEHGGVDIWYNTTNQDAINLLAQIAKDAEDHGKFVVMTKYTDMEPDTIALTAWTRLDKFPVGDLTKDRVTKFIDAHDKRFNPEGY